MSDAATPPSEVETTPPQEHDEYQRSGARFRRWNLITLILGLVCLGVGLWVVSTQRQESKRGGGQTEKAE